MFDDSIALWLNWSSIVRKEGGKLVDLFGGDFDRLCHHKPEDILGAGWGRKGAAILVELAIGGQQVGGIDGGFNFDGLGFGGHGVPDRLQGCMGGSDLGEYANDGKFSSGRLVNQMQFQVVGFAQDKMFAGMVEMKLLQMEGFALKDNMASRRVVHLNCAGVVGDVKGSGLIVNL